MSTLEDTILKMLATIEERSHAQDEYWRGVLEKHKGEMRTLIENYELERRRSPSYVVRVDVYDPLQGRGNIIPALKKENAAGWRFRTVDDYRNASVLLDFRKVRDLEGVGVGDWELHILACVGTEQEHPDPDELVTTTIALVRYSRVGYHEPGKPERPYLVKPVGERQTFEVSGSPFNPNDIESLPQVAQLTVHRTVVPLAEIPLGPEFGLAQVYNFGHKDLLIHGFELHRRIR